MLSAPLPMKRISLFMVDADAQTAAMTLARMAVLHPVASEPAADELDGFPASPYHAVYHNLDSRFSKIAGYLEFPVKQVETADRIVTLEQLREVDASLRELWARVSDIEERLRRQAEKINAIRQLASSLEKFASLDLDLSRLRRRGKFLRIFVGSVPSTNVDQLRRALSLTGFMTQSFYSGEGVDHVVVFGSSEQQEDVQEVLNSADFRGLTIPDEFSGSPAELQQDLNQQIDAVDRRIESLRQQLAELLSADREMLQRAHDYLVLARPYASLAEVLRGRGGLVGLQGWVPAARIEDIRQQLEQQLQFPFHVEFIDPTIAEYAQVPSLMPRHTLRLRWQTLFLSAAAMAR